MRPTRGQRCADPRMAALRQARGDRRAVRCRASPTARCPTSTASRWRGRSRHDQRLRSTPVVMLTSVGRSPTMPRAAGGSGVDAYLTKPVKHSDLLDTLATLVGVSTGAGTQRSGQTPAGRREPRAAAADPGRRGQSREPEAGHDAAAEARAPVKAVENGREAVAAIRAVGARSFDVVLMDLQMPEMGGFEATQAIRARESPTGAATSHRRADRARDAGRPRALPRRRDGRLSLQADRRRRARRDGRAIRRRHAVGRQSRAPAAPAGDQRDLRRAGGALHTPAATAGC